MFELVVGGGGLLAPIIVQNQSYSTSTRQTLFHTQTAAATDTEAFALSGFPGGGGIDLAQTSSATGVGTECGFFTSSASSNIIAPVHIGSGFLGTWIGDPLATGTPIFAGMIFPQMVRSNTIAMAPAIQAVPIVSVGGAAGTTSGDRTKKAIELQPVISNSLNQSPASLIEINATRAAGTATKNVSAGNESAKNVTPGKEAAPSPRPPETIIPRGQVFYHQQNKPFSTAITYPYGPFKATPEKVRNTSSYDRWLMNTVGRSTMDKAFDGTTSSPTYITPGKALAEQIPYEFIQGGLSMTMPGTRLGYRAWPL